MLGRVTNEYNFESVGLKFLGNKIYVARKFKIIIGTPIS